MFTQWIAKSRAICLAAGLWMAFPAAVFADINQVSLPLEVPDAFGTRWDVQSNGTIGDGGDDQFDIASELRVNGDFVYSLETEVGKFDEKSREYLFPAQMYQDLSISRRVHINVEKGFCRWTETLKNESGKAQSVSLQLQTGIGRGISSTRDLIDEKNPSRKYGCVVSNSDFGFLFIGAGRGVKMPVQCASREMNVSIRYRFDVPPKKTVSIVHAIVARKSVNPVKKLGDAEIISGIPAEILREVINFRSRDTLAPELDLLKPVGHDAIEMEGGDQYVGAVAQNTLALETSHGKIAIPIDQIMGILRAKTARKSFLIALKDDQILSGKLAGTFKFTLSDQRTIEFPAERISRVGIRQADPENPTNAPFVPMIVLRTGACYRMEGIDGNLDFQTRFGKYSLPFSKINAIHVPDDAVASPFHEIALSDGSVLRGIILNSSLKFQGQGVLKEKAIELPLSAVSAAAMAKPLEDLAPSVAAIETVSGDLIAGKLKGEISLSNNLGALKLDATQIRRFEPVKGSDADVAVTLWDQSRIVGEIADQNLLCRTEGGLEFSISSSMILSFDQPIPSFPADIAAEIRGKLKTLLEVEQAEDRNAQWGGIQRFGPGLMPILDAIAKDQPEEKRKILKEYENLLKPLAVRTPKVEEPEVVFDSRPDYPYPDEFMPPDFGFDGGFFEDDIMNKDGVIDFEPPEDMEFFNKP